MSKSIHSQMVPPVKTKEIAASIAPTTMNSIPLYYPLVDNRRAKNFSVRIMAGKECYHCREIVPLGVPHDCWTTTEEKLTEELSETLRDAWGRLRETASAFGDQRIYASHKSIMFSRKACYFFVRPKKNVLEVCVFLGRKLQNPLVRKVYESSQVKTAHLIHVSHRDEVEAPLTDWLKEAYEVSPHLKAVRRGKSVAKARPKKTARKSAAKKAVRKRKTPKGKKK